MSNLAGSQPALEEIKRLREADEKRRESTRVCGRNFLFFLVGLLVFIAASYFYLHQAYPPAKTGWRPADLVQLDSAGRLCHLSEADIRWYLGKEEAGGIIASLKDRSQRIDELHGKVMPALLEFQVRLREALNKAHFSNFSFW